MIRPISLEIVEVNEQEKARIRIPAPDGASYRQLWVHTVMNPPVLALFSNASAPIAASTEWTNLWNIDMTTQPDGTQSVCDRLRAPSFPLSASALELRHQS